MHLRSLILIMLVCLPTISWSANIDYVLDVQIDINNQKISGTTILKANTDREIWLSVRNLQKLKVDGNPITSTTHDNIRLTMEKGKEKLIRYEAKIINKRDNFIDQNNVFLTKDWYPQPNVLVEYALSVTLPKYFIATSEAEVITIREQGGTKTFSFQFKHLLDTLSLAASTQYVLKRDFHNNITIEAYFFKEDEHLADTYIAHSKKYLAMYEAMLTPYPYRRFAIVENILPSGNSMPTYTLLGKQVVHLPFIVKTSLGHEILHQWFGNSIYIDNAHGNWSEGITTYLADHHYTELENKDTAYRKQILMNYNAYVNADNVISLSDFVIRHNKSLSAVGYSKSAMLFHGLRRRFGDKAFFAALREFIHRNSFRKASWHDIQRAFEKVTGEKLYAAFGHWLNRRDIPQFEVDHSELQVDKGQIKLNFNLLQIGEAYPLRLPIALYTVSGRMQRIVNVTDSEENISLTLDELPNKVVIDEDYDLMRQLAPEEIPPILASIMGKQSMIGVISAEQRDIFQPIVDALGIENIAYKTPDDINFIQIKENSMMIADYGNPLVDMLFGKQTTPTDGVRLKVFKNPYNPTERILLLHARNTSEAQAVRQKISHYGKYSELGFNGGQNTYKSVVETKKGIFVFSRPANRVLNPRKMTTLLDIQPELIKRRIIYIGEQHNNFAHHINQLQIIKKLYEAGYKIAVGMEMFQMPYQQIADDYIAGRIDEYAFLKKTEYFSRWGYDYNLYKPIIDYLVQEKIPLVALNIERNITRKVARSGLHNISDEERKLLPSEMDFSNERYRDDLIEVFAHHSKQKYNDFNYFLQAQTLWDESMAESAQQFLEKNPEFKLVILAGNGHIRHKYGIPDRLYRRNHEPFTSIIQDEEEKNDIADYILLTTELNGKKSPRLGLLIKRRDQDLVVMGVSDDSPAEKAGLQKGDIIEQITGQPIKLLADLKLALFYSEIGDTIKIQIKREKQTLHKEIELFRF